MKVKEQHLRIINQVKDISSHKCSLGGASQADIEGFDNFDRTLKAMVKAGLLEQFSIRNLHLFRVGTEGAKLLLAKAINAETKPIEERIAMRLVGVPIASVRAIKGPVYVMKAEIFMEKITVAMQDIVAMQDLTEGGLR